MNIYLISQDKNDDYEAYDLAVVVAENEEQARMIHPSLILEWDHKSTGCWDKWVNSEDVNVKFIGTTEIDEPLVICASYNAE